MGRVSHIPVPVTPVPEGTVATLNSVLRCVYTGYGPVTFDGRILAMTPRQATTVTETHAALVVAERSLPAAGYRVSWRARTVRQMRVGSPPNPWEAAWFMFDYVDPDHCTYLVLKPNGWELGRRDPTGNGGQLFIATDGWANPAPDLSSFRTVHIERRGDTLLVSVPSMGLNITRIVPFTFNDGVTATGCETAFYSEDAAVECSGWVTA